MKTLRKFARPLGLALFAILLTPLALKAIDCTTDMCGFSGGQITGLRDTFVDQLNTETIAGAKTWSAAHVFNGNVELSGTTTVSGAVNMTSTIQIGGTTMSSTAEELDDVTVTIVIDDISTNGTDSIASHWTGNVTDWYCILDGAIASVGALLTLSANGNDITSGGTLTVTFTGSAQGDLDLANSISGTNAIVKGELIAIHTDGASTNVVKEVCTIVIER